MTADSDSFSTSGTSVSIGPNALFYLTEREGLHPYLTPSFSYRRSSTTIGNASTSHDNSYLLAGSFGAEYALGRRFSLFGELGLAYTHITSSLRLSGSTSSGTSTGTGTRVGTRTAVGVVIWF